MDIRNFFKKAKEPPDEDDTSPRRRPTGIEEEEGELIDPPAPYTSDAIGKSKRVVASFSSKWLADPMLGPWLSRTSNGSALCKVCEHRFPKGVNKSGLMKHARSGVHQRFTKDVNTSQPLQVVDKEALKTAHQEFVIAGHYAEHLISYLGADHLSEILRDRFGHKSYAAKRTKIQYLIAGIAEEESIKLKEKMQTEFFSVCLDEATDISTTSKLAVTVCFKDSKQRRHPQGLGVNGHKLGELRVDNN